MHGDASRKADALNRFGREARAAAGLSSPHVVRIIDFGVDEASDRAFLAMELLLGESLSQRLKQSGRTGLPRRHARPGSTPGDPPPAAALDDPGPNPAAG